MMTGNTPPEAGRLRTFGRIGGRPLSPRQQALVETLLPQISIDLRQPVTVLALFGDARPLWLEIGFGGGEHLVEQARRRPDVGLIGCEPYLEGVAKALTGIAAAALANVRLHRGDAREVIDALPARTLDRIYIMFPDPWPKKRHQKRRIVQPDFLNAIHHACEDGARVRFATDVAGYADEALARFLAHGGFDWQARQASDWRVPPGDHVTTRYEEKRLGDCAPVFFDFVVRHAGPSGEAPHAHFSTRSGLTRD